MLYGSFVLYGLIAGVMGLVTFFTIRRAREPWRRRLTWMPAMVPDENGRFLHIFGAERISPEDGDSYDIFHHRLFDTRSFTILQGASQKGSDLELDSPFVDRSLAGFREEHGLVLRPIRDYEYKDVTDDDDDERDREEEERNSRIARMSDGADDVNSGTEDDTDDSPEDEPGEGDTLHVTGTATLGSSDTSTRPPEPPKPRVQHGPVVEVRNADESDTMKPKPAPPFCVLFFENEEARRFRTEVYRDGRRLAVHEMKGDPDYFCHKFYDAAADRLFFTYNKNNYAGMAVSVIDMKTGALLCDKFCDPDKPAEKQGTGSTPPSRRS